MPFKNFLAIFILSIQSFCLTSQQIHYKVYKINFKDEIAYIGTGVGLSILSRILINNADKATLEDLNMLDPMDIPAFDRGAIYNFSTTAQTFSDILLFTGATLPFLTFVNKTCRSQANAIVVMAVETFFFTNAITNMAKATAKRYRPFNYNSEVPDRIKLGSRSRFSFFSGHVSVSAAMSFFTARVLTDLRPNMKNKYLIWTTAATIPAVISYLRYEAGKHFPTDLIAGYAVGATIGYIIPTLHLNKNIDLKIAAMGGINLSINLK